MGAKLGLTLREEHTLRVNLWFSGLLCLVVWWLDINILEDCAAFLFKVEVHDEWKVEIDTSRI
jgi:hypothetical protein